MHAIATAMLGAKHGGSAEPPAGDLVADPSGRQDVPISGDPRLFIEERRRALHEVGYYGHAEMLLCQEAGNAIVDKMSHAHPDQKGHPAPSFISKTFSYVRRHGLVEENRRAYHDWALTTYDPQTGWASAREILNRARDSRRMRNLALHNERHGLCLILYREDG